MRGTPSKCHRQFPLNNIAFHNMADPRIEDVVKELHGDLSRKYRRHAAAIKDAWRSFDKAQRTRCVKAGAADGAVLKHSLDQSMGNVYKIMPEWNLKDMTEPGSDFLLDMLEFRATTSLFQQYSTGPNGKPGDRDFIMEMMSTKNLRHVEPFKNCYSFFMDEQYGKSYHIKTELERTLEEFAPAIRAGICIPQSCGQLILERQSYLLQGLNILVEDILEEGSKTRQQKTSAKKNNKKADGGASAALEKLSIQDPNYKKPTLPDILVAATDRRQSLSEYLELFSGEPVVLAHIVNAFFFSRPQLVLDEKGRRLPVHTDKYIGPAFFDAVRDAVNATAIWQYLARLVELLCSATGDKIYRGILLQEITNVCAMEYERCKTALKRQLQTGVGTKWFKRVSNAADKSGGARVIMKSKPEEVAVSGPHLYYLLRLCLLETDSAKAIELLQKLGEIYQARPSESEVLTERETEALYDLTMIVSFLQDLSSVTKLPSVSRKKGQLFITRCQGIVAELDNHKEELDLTDYVIPIDNLLEPGMADGALKAMDQFVVEKAGTKLGFLFEDAVEESLSEISVLVQEGKATPDKAEPSTVSQLSPFDATATSTASEIVASERRLKEKTRPSHSSVFDITPPTPTKPSADEEPTSPAQIFKVSAPTAEVFSRLFTKSRARGSVNWSSFESAMADLGFSVMPKYGSVYTFRPDANRMATVKPFTVHRPHQSRIEGHLIPIIARRLKRIYGWGEGTFKST